MAKAASSPECGVAVARIRCRVWFVGQAAQQLVALVPRALPAAGAGDAVVRLVDDDQLGAAQQELVAAAVGLDEVGGRR